MWLGDRNGGRIVSPDEAVVSVLDHGFTVADGVFETLKVIGSTPFALTRHLDRLARSAAVLGLAAPEESVLREAVASTCAVTESDVSRLRITYTGGAGPLGTDRGDAVPTLTTALSPAVPWPSTTSALTVPWTRNERSALAGVKSTSYGENVIALQAAHEAGASEAIFANSAGALCEGTGSNIFVVVDGRVLTPSLGSGCLAGVTRALVLEWCDAAEADLPIDVLATCDEVFLTSSTRDVHPVTRLDDRVWDEAGPITSEVRARFASRADADLDP
jgi:branched-chain amino acid aminotransferase